VDRRKTVWHFPVGIEENRKNVSHDIRSTSLNLIPVYEAIWSNTKYYESIRINRKRHEI